MAITARCSAVGCGRATAALDAEGLRGWLQALPSDVFRVKGLVKLAQGNKAHWLQHVGTRSQFSPATDRSRRQYLPAWCSSRAGVSMAGRRWGQGLEACTVKVSV